MTQIDYSANVRFSGHELDPSPWDQITHLRYLSDPADSQIAWGHNSDPRGLLTPGETYAVERVEIHSWHTKVFLVGIDCGRGFNSVSFEDVSA